MSFLVLGYLVLVYWAFYQSNIKFAESTRWLQEKLSVSPQRSFFDFASRLKVSVLLSSSPFEARKSAMIKLEDKSWSERYALFYLCVAGLSSFIWVLISALAFNISGAFLLVFGALGALLPKKLPSLSSFAWMIFFIGLFLQGLELALRSGAFLIKDSQFEDIVFALADNRWPAVFMWFAFALIVSVFVQLEAWTLVLSIFGIYLGIMSLNTAVSLVIGESLAWFAILLWQSRKMSKSQKVAKGMLLIEVVSAVVFFLGYGWSRSELVLFELGSFDNVTQRLNLFLITFLAWIVFQTAVLSVWGHFRAKRPV
jgi:hypothetical protein